MKSDKANLIKVIITTIVDVVVSIISLFRDEKKNEKPADNDASPNGDTTDSVG